jgi:tetratricopeptide (TPR) repeat protein
LQLAEAQLKAGRQPQAAVLLRKLLEAEPDNLRVQVRLGELHLAMGQPAEAIETFHNAMQRVLDQGDHKEAIRLADRILELDPARASTFLLKVRALSASGQSADATKLLESLPDQDGGGETTAMLLEIHAESGQLDKAASLAEKVFARDPKKYLVTHGVANMLLEAGDLKRANALLALIRNTMIDSGDHEALAQTINKVAERSPGQIEPLEWLVDLYGRASDSFRLPDALAQLAQAYEKAGNEARALATYEQLLERTPEDETPRRKYMRLRTKTGLAPASAEMPLPVKLAPEEGESKPVPPTSNEAPLEEETQRYVTQALTDVDLFSSYGLTQKAIDLLESVLERAPRHTPVLERLLDLSVGAGNDRRTVELAATLENIAIARRDRAAADRYSEFRRRYQRTTGLPITAPTPPPAAVPQEFVVPIVEAELDEPVAELLAEPSAPEPMGIPMPAESAVHEVDLSDEWASLSQQLEDSIQREVAASATKKPLAPQPELVAQILNADSSGPESFPAFDLELQSVTLAGNEEGDTSASDALLAELAADLESATMSLGIGSKGEHPMSADPRPPMNPSNGGTSGGLPPNGSGANGLLSDLFEEFRSEMGESNTDDEDLETHYNLGIAYREMGLLEEAISEFQKVAQAAEKGPAFRYAMQCCTLLGLAFMDKGQPAIAAIWYERALRTPGLDQESILALRYDLGVAQELAGETSAAFKSFSQVYAMNIDYRDVSERIALLGKSR